METHLDGINLSKVGFKLAFNLMETCLMFVYFPKPVVRIDTSVGVTEIYLKYIFQIKQLLFFFKIIIIL